MTTSQSIAIVVTVAILSIFTTIAFSYSSYQQCMSLSYGVTAQAKCAR